MKINTKKTFFKIFFVLLIITGGFYIYTNPSLLSHINTLTTTNNTRPQTNVSVNELENKIILLEAKLANIPNFNTKADTSLVEELKTDIKATQEALTELQRRIREVSKTTSNNALVLTSAVMVKDQALSGKSFSSQAFLLDSLAKTDPKLKEDAKTIKEISAQGIKSDIALIDEFNTIYNTNLEHQKKLFDEANKSTIKTKLDSFIKLVKVNKETKEFAPSQELETIKNLVNNKNFFEALNSLEKNTNDNLQINEKLSDWKDNIKRRETLYKSIDNVIGSSVIAINFEAFNKE